MKKVLVILFVGIVLFGACSAQNANAQSSNIAQKIIGTWVDQNGTTWVFNANGNLTMGREEYKFGVTDTMLAYYMDDRSSGYAAVFYISISSDGKTIILMASGAPNGYWLTKK